MKTAPIVTVFLFVLTTIPSSHGEPIPPVDRAWAEMLVAVNRAVESPSPTKNHLIARAADALFYAYVKAAPALSYEEAFLLAEKILDFPSKRRYSPLSPEADEVFSRPEWQTWVAEIKSRGVTVFAGDGSVAAWRRIGETALDPDWKGLSGRTLWDVAKSLLRATPSRERILALSELRLKLKGPASSRIAEVLEELKRRGTDHPLHSSFLDALMAAQLPAESPSTSAPAHTIPIGRSEKIVFQNATPDRLFELLRIARDSRSADFATMSQLDFFQGLFGDKEDLSAGRPVEWHHLSTVTVHFGEMISLLGYLQRQGLPVEILFARVEGHPDLDPINPFDEIIAKVAELQMVDRVTQLQTMVTKNAERAGRSSLPISDAARRALEIKRAIRIAGKTAKR
jgi:hypothetical protein